MTNYNVYLLQMPDPAHSPSRNLKYGFDSYVAAAATSADAAAFIENLADSSAWGNANLVTPALVASGYVGTPDMTGWSLRVRIFNASDGSVYTDQMVSNTPSSANEASAFATGTLTGTTTAFVAGDTVTIGTRVYTFETSVGTTDGHVKVGGTYAASFTNLQNAINNSGGVPGTDYYVLAADPNVTAVASSLVLTVTARKEGADANSVATTVGGGNTGDAAWGHTTLQGGSGETANTMSALAAQMVTALNASGAVAHAAWNNSTQVLTVAGTADNIGNDLIEVSVYPPPYQIVSGQVSPADQLPDYDPNFLLLEPNVGVNVKVGYAVPGFVISVTDGGSAGSALTATLVADTYPVPALVLASRAQE